VMPPGFTDDLARRVVGRLGQGFIGPEPIEGLDYRLARRVRLKVQVL
jgi:hypothetical protein